MNSDVAAFATRAKVVYPINQKYRVSVPQYALHAYILHCMLKLKQLNAQIMADYLLVLH